MIKVFGLWSEDKKEKTLGGFVPATFLSPLVRRNVVFIREMKQKKKKMRILSTIPKLYEWRKRELEKVMTLEMENVFLFLFFFFFFFSFFWKR